MNKRWISHEEIARALGVSRQTVHARLRSKAIPGQTKYLGMQRIDRAVFEEFLRSVKSVKIA